MTPYETFNEYLQVKNHLTQKRYQYGSGRRPKFETFEARNDKSFFYKAAKLPNPTGFFVSNIIKKPDIWIGDLIGAEESIETYKQWKKRTSGLMYYFKNDLGNLKSVFKDNFSIDKDGNLPYIIRQYFNNKISIETLTMISGTLGLTKYWKEKVKDPLIEQILILIEKYEFFLSYNKSDVKKILKEEFNINNKSVN